MKSGNKIASNEQQQNDNSDVLVRGIVSIMKRRKTPWVGTVSELNERLEYRFSSIPTSWAASPSTLRVALNKVVRRLNAAGITVRFSRSTDHSRTRLVKFVA